MTNSAAFADGYDCQVGPKLGCRWTETVTRSNGTSVSGLFNRFLLNPPTNPTELKKHMHGVVWSLDEIPKNGAVAMDATLATPVYNNDNSFAYWTTTDRFDNMVGDASAAWAHAGGAGLTFDDVTHPLGTPNADFRISWQTGGAISSGNGIDNNAVTRPQKVVLDPGYGGTGYAECAMTQIKITIATNPHIQDNGIDYPVTWIADPSNEVTSGLNYKFSLPAVLIHEIGHTLGLDHVADFQTTVGCMDEVFNSSNRSRAVTVAEGKYIQQYYTDTGISFLDQFCVVDSLGRTCVRWTVESSSGALAYEVIKGQSDTSLTTRVGIVSAAGAGSYEIVDVGTRADLYCLREITTSYDTLRVRMEPVGGDFAAVGNAGMYADSSGFQAARGPIATRPPDPTTTVPVCDWLCLLPPGSGADWVAAATRLRLFWENRGYTTCVESYAPELLPSIRANARYVLLAGDANDYVPWTRDWGSIWSRPNWPTQPQWDFIPMSRYVEDDDHGLLTSMSRITPYWASDWDYGSLIADHMPQHAVGRAPVRSAAEFDLFVDKTILAANATPAQYASAVGLWFYGQDATGSWGDPLKGWRDAVVKVIPPAMSVTTLESTNQAPVPYATREAAAVSGLSAGQQLTIGMGTSSSRYSFVEYADYTHGFTWQKVAQNSNPSFLLGLCCGMGDCDRTEDPRYGRGLLETSLLEHNRGLWGGFAPSRGSFTGGDCILGEYFLQALYVDGAESVGDAARAAVCRFVATYPSRAKEALSYVFMGDPLVPLPQMRRSVRVLSASEGGALCPAGDAGRVLIRAYLAGITGITITSPLSQIWLDRTSGATNIRIWDGPGGSPHELTRIYPISYDAAARVATFEIKRCSGSGVFGAQLVVGGATLWAGACGPIVSMDQDGLCNGAVDRYDSLACATGASGSWDLDGNGEVTNGDRVLLANHRGHCKERRVIGPNGGEHLGWGETLHVSWVVGGGDSSKVEIDLVRDSQAGTGACLAFGVPDNGAADLLLYPTDAPASDYRIKIVHMAGTARGVRGAGIDQSDGVFSIDAAGGGGCPTLDTRSGGVWHVENTVLGRSLTASMGMDAFRMSYVDPNDTTVIVRVREDEAESTILDNLRLIAIDHRPGLITFANGDTVLLGTRAPAQAVHNGAGDDLTGDMTSWAGAAVAAGETLFVDLPYGSAGARNAPVRALSGGGGFVIDDGGGKGGVPQARIERPSSAQSVDAQVLSETGVLVDQLGGDGAWVRVAHYYPRERSSEGFMDSVTSSRVRLIFLDSHQVRFLGTVIPAPDSLIATKLQLQSAVHSRLGDVTTAVSTFGNLVTAIQQSDTVTVTFVNTTPPDGLVRDYLLFSRGVYTTNLPARQRPVDVPTKFAIYGARPNPAMGAVQLRIDVPQAASVSVAIYDAQGRRIIRLADGMYLPGTYTLGWDRKDLSGRRAAPGLYLCKMEACGRSFTMKVVAIQ